jgi:hypothetical protein
MSTPPDDYRFIRRAILRPEDVRLCAAGGLQMSAVIDLNPTLLAAGAVALVATFSCY